MLKEKGRNFRCDQDLWNQFRAGDRLAYTELMHKFSNPLFKYGIRFSCDRDFIKDCIQDVFFELWNRRERISEAASVKAYLFKALRLRIFREQPKWNNTESLTEEYPFLVEFDIENRFIQEQNLEELSVKIKNILNALPQRQKEILYLRFYENLDHERIAQIMGLHRQSVYNLLQKSFSSFRKEWHVLLLLILRHTIV